MNWSRNYLNGKDKLQFFRFHPTRLYRNKLFQIFLLPDYIVLCYYQLEKQGMEVQRVYIGRATEYVISEWLELAREVEPIFQGSMADNVEFHAFMRSKINKNEAIVARDIDHSNELMGLITISHSNNRISWFAVNEKYRGKGIGSKLLEYAINELDSKKEIFVTTFRADYEQGKPARHVYNKLGFADYDTSVFHDGQPRSLMRRLPQDKDTFNRITFRAMEISDLDEVITLWRNITELSFPVSFDTKERLTKFLHRNQGLSSVAKVECKIVGALLCGHDGRRGFFYHTGVDYAYRKQGIATRMIERCFDMLKKEGIDNCFLFTNDFNRDAQKFWKAMGFGYAPHVMYHSRGI